MDKAKAQQMFKLADRLSKVNVNELNEAQRTEYSAMVAKLQEEAAKVKESTGKFDKKEVKPGVTQYTRKSDTYTKDTGSSVAAPTVHTPSKRIEDDNEREYDARDDDDIEESAPKGWEGTVKAMKKHKDEIDNPYALSWYMKNKGYKSHKKESVEEEISTEAYDRLKRVFDFSDYKG